ncbi:unnamed protein product [Lathyrus oleraceus]
MGSACCVAVKDRSDSTNRIERESLHRDVARSPSWSFRWDSRGRVTGEIQNPSYHSSHAVSRNVSMEFKGSLSSYRSNLSDGGSIVDNSATPVSLKSPVNEALAANIMTPSSDLSMSSSFSTVVKNPGESSIPNHSFSIPSVLSTPKSGPLYNHDYHHPNSTPTRWAHRSLGKPLLRQISDNQIMGLKSPDSSIFEGRVSFVLSACSNDIEAISQCGSSDGWSMHTFSELVASQRGRWSFDSECLGSGRRKISGSSSRLSYSPSMDLQSCGACTKLLSDKSAWSNQKFVANSDLSVVAVLICGHTFHAECLETMTAEADKYDPSCPICMVGDKHFSKLSRKCFRAEAEMKAKNHKISRNRVVDSYLDGGFDVFDGQKDMELGGKVSKMEASSSTRSSVGKPFLRRHFSNGSKCSRSLSENDSPRKKGFWARYRKD